MSSGHNTCHLPDMRRTMGICGQRARSRCRITSVQTAMHPIRSNCALSGFSLMKY